MKPLLISSGEPAGIGPDICLALAELELPVVILGDKAVLSQRALQLKRSVELVDYDPTVPLVQRQNSLAVCSIPCINPVIQGQLDATNAIYVLNLLQFAADECQKGNFSALVTAPIHKAIINQAGIPFVGHTEFLAQHFEVETVVMMLECEALKVALITTHLPLHSVSAAINVKLIIKIITQLNKTLREDFGIKNPCILMAGLNPHAGENGYLGREEIETISPAIKLLREQEINIEGPFPADTLFTPKNLSRADVFVTMYHDQGLPVLKYAGFGHAVNVTLGLPIIRTSVDHGTALELAGTGQAEISSLIAAVRRALSMVKERHEHKHSSSN